LLAVDRNTSPTLYLINQWQLQGATQKIAATALRPVRTGRAVGLAGSQYASRKLAIISIPKDEAAHRTDVPKTSAWGARNRSVDRNIFRRKPYPVIAVRGMGAACTTKTPQSQV